MRHTTIFTPPMLNLGLLGGAGWVAGQSFAERCTVTEGLLPHNSQSLINAVHKFDGLQFSVSWPSLFPWTIERVGERVPPLLQPDW
ncbi:hypothetical protein M427DRAFT_405549 [Gonapodya prolifera JEL478]|uniref:Uncharacterized protein n=1 Tax=Gonapodya prolifera (strain JEL478) TaxID=1344416 RepID=A0A139AU24_GONPJ|nr:hypothetical protein M427DRAFT_405549 [Gonapodya prolifera JEL478]|eukprot:KXS20246.1 hypothetical protein M427DRAFT_405549 [Gonapodya prolifera JEL478]